MAINEIADLPKMIYTARHKDLSLCCDMLCAVALALRERAAAAETSCIKQRHALGQSNNIATNVNDLVESIKLMRPRYTRQSES